MGSSSSVLYGLLSSEGCRSRSRLWWSSGPVPIRARHLLFSDNVDLGCWLSQKVSSSEGTIVSGIWYQVIREHRWVDCWLSLSLHGPFPLIILLVIKNTNRTTKNDAPIYCFSRNYFFMEDHINGMYRVCIRAQVHWFETDTLWDLDIQGWVYMFSLSAIHPVVLNRLFLQ